MRVCSTCGHTWDAALGPCLHDGSTPVAAASALPKVLVELHAEGELAAGTRVGAYRIEKVIGIGGMGVVYGACHTQIGKRAAIKVLSAKYCADRVAVERFVQEAQSVNKIGHPNIVDIFSVGRLEDGRSYLVMEWIDGETLDARIERLQRLPIEEVLAILVPLTRALDAAHAADVIHRDIKPDNVLLIPDDDGLRVKLLDFGIAKLSTTQSLIASRTASGMTIGTPLFMSPEQAKGVAVSAASDVYSLGVLAYMMVCGTTPFEGEGSSVEILNAHIKTPPLPPGAHRPDVPPALESLILELLAKNPAARPALADVRLRLKRIANVLATGFEEAPRTASLSFRQSGADRAQPEPPVRAGSEDPIAYETVSGPSSRRRWLVPGVAVTIVCLIAAIAAVRAQRDSVAASPSPLAPAVATAPPPSVVTAPPLSVVEAAVVTPPVASPGWIHVAIRPRTAKVSIDGLPVALAAGRARVELAAGVHAIEIAAPGHVAIRRQIEVARGQGSELGLELEPAKARPAKPAKLATPGQPGYPGSPGKPPRSSVDPDAVVNPFARRGE